MPRWNDSVVLADNDSLTGGEAVSGDTKKIRAPTVCVRCDDLEGATDDTVTVRVVGDAGTYDVAEETFSAAGESAVVDVPQAPTVEIESAGGVTYSAEVRTNGR